jgi:hypothetical protein
VLASVGVEGRVSAAELRRGVFDGESTSGTKPGPGQSSARQLAKEHSTSAMTPFTRSTLLVLCWCSEPKMIEAPSVACSPAQKALVTVRHQHVRQPHVAKNRSNEVARRRF